MGIDTANNYREVLMGIDTANNYLSNNPLLWQNSSSVGISVNNWTYGTGRPQEQDDLKSAIDRCVDEGRPQEQDDLKSAIDRCVDDLKKNLQ